MTETKTWAIFIVLFCTLFTSTAQILLKFGMNSFSIVTILTNYFLMGGLLIYILGAALLILAFKGGEVTVIYPVFATSYIWVLILSNLFLGEVVTPMKLFAVLIIVTGVFMVTRGGKYSTGVVAK